LIDDDARRPVLHPRRDCRIPKVKGLTTMVNSIYNSWRFEDLWLEQGVGSSTSGIDLPSRRAV
jgi:hypothetical protein